MPIIMCTRRLWAAIGGRGKLPPRVPESSSASRLGAWSAAEVMTNAGYVVVAVEESTYLTIVCPVVSLPMLPRVFAASVWAVMEELGLPADVAAREATAIIDGTRFAKNDNRSLTGSVTDVAYNAQVELTHARSGDLAAIGWVQRELNDMPHVHRSPPFPSAAVRLLFASAHSVH